MKTEPVVVVGTTPDYVARIYERHPESTVFVLDHAFQDDPQLDGIHGSILFFASLEKITETVESFLQYLSYRNIQPSGIACFDCESLILAGNLAAALEKPFPTLQGIVRTRNKFMAREIWKRKGVDTPAATLVSSLKETIEFFYRAGQDVVLKPISGSGSELVFHCESAEEVAGAVRVMEEELPKRRSNPLFKPIPVSHAAASSDPCVQWIVEEFISGPEFSCDFLFQDSQITILRETGKIRAIDKSFGSVLAYLLFPSYPNGFSKTALLDVFQRACEALGFTWGHFMVDFIIRNGKPVIIELTPRPGGDSIPDLMEVATGIDVLGMHLEIATGRFRIPKEIPVPPESFASINIFAPMEGIIRHLDSSRLPSFPWMRKLVLKKKVGERVLLPPKDYDNRLLGFCIISYEPSWDLPSISHTVENAMEVVILDSQDR